MKAGRNVDDVGIDSTFLTPNWMVWNLELNKEHCNSQSLRILAIFESFTAPFRFSWLKQTFKWTAFRAHRGLELGLVPRNLELWLWKQLYSYPTVSSQESPLGSMKAVNRLGAACPTCVCECYVHAANRTFEKETKKERVEADKKKRQQRQSRDGASS